MLVPATAMGATLPVVVPRSSSTRSQLRPHPGPALRLEHARWRHRSARGRAALIGPLGLRGTGLAAAALEPQRGGLGPLRHRDARGPRKPSRRRRSPVRARGTRAARLLAAGALSGGILLALEVVWFRFLLLFAFGSSRTSRSCWPSCWRASAWARWPRPGGWVGGRRTTRWLRSSPCWPPRRACRPMPASGCRVRRGCPAAWPSTGSGSCCRRAFSRAPSSRCWAGPSRPSLATRRAPPRVSRSRTRWVGWWAPCWRGSRCCRCSAWRRPSSCWRRPTASSRCAPAGRRQARRAGRSGARAPRRHCRRPGFRSVSCGIGSCRSCATGWWGMRGCSRSAKAAPRPSSTWRSTRRRSPPNTGCSRTATPCPARTSSAGATCGCSCTGPWRSSRGPSARSSSATEWAPRPRP